MNVEALRKLVEGLELVAAAVRELAGDEAPPAPTPRVEGEPQKQPAPPRRRRLHLVEAPADVTDTDVSAATRAASRRGIVLDAPPATRKKGS